jgi:hypothetical protein
VVRSAKTGSFVIKAARSSSAPSLRDLSVFPSPG